MVLPSRYNASTANDESLIMTFIWLRPRVVRAALLAFGISLSPAIISGGWALGVRASGNVHKVEPGQLYRSAQLTGPKLNEVIDRYGKHTVSLKPNQDEPDTLSFLSLLSGLVRQRTLGGNNQGSE